MFILDGIMRLCCCVNFFHRCNIGQQVCEYPGVTCYDVYDYALIYDSRASMHLLVNVNISSLGEPPVGGTVVLYGITFKRIPADINELDPPWIGGGGSCPRCGGTPAARLRGIFYACDYA